MRRGRWWRGTTEAGGRWSGHDGHRWARPQRGATAWPESERPLELWSKVQLTPVRGAAVWPCPCPIEVPSPAPPRVVVRPRAPPVPPPVTRLSGARVHASTRRAAPRRPLSVVCTRTGSSRGSVLCATPPPLAYAWCFVWLP
ncbi:hypothetical protein BS78_10G096100 [Paspalum vaginatum]|nr:hypothetical protein BS78_10G096100 [Paspalum vaginatum]